MEKLNTNILKWLFWGGLIIVLAKNVIHLDNGINKIIHKPVFKFRLDYLLHFISFLVCTSIYFIRMRKGSPISLINLF